MIFGDKNTKQTVVALCLIGTAVIYALIGIAHPPEGTTITNEAVSSFLYKTGQRVVLHSNMTETTVLSASIVVMMELDLTAKSLVANGEDSCQVRATLFDAMGQLVPDGQPVAFTTTAGRFANGMDTTFTVSSGGVATALLKSSVAASGQPIYSNVTAATIGASGQSVTRTAPVVFYAAALTGLIASPSSREGSNTIVAVFNSQQQEVGRDTVSGIGSFLVPVTQSGLFTLAISYVNRFGDDIVFTANRFVNVPQFGGEPAVSLLSTIAGNLVDLATDMPVRKNVSVMLRPISNEAQIEGRQLPAFTMSDERGVFVFDSLAGGTYEVHVMDVRYSGRLTLQPSSSGVFIIDANVGLMDTPSFEVTKSNNKRIAEIGDAVMYSVEVKNTSPATPLFKVRLIDMLPHAFVYAKNSAWQDGLPLSDPLDFRKLEWALADTLHAGQTIRVSYVVHLGAGSLESDGINRAYAIAEDLAGQPVRTAEATSPVIVRPGVFTDRGIVIGKIFYDENENARQDDGEKGIADVELLMEDGTRIITGDDGKYSLPEVRPGQHVIRVNHYSLPYGSELLPLASDFAGDGLSRFIRMTEGGIARSDFYVRSPNAVTTSAVYERFIAKHVGERIPSFYAMTFRDIGEPSKISLTDSLPEGYAFDLQSVTYKNAKPFPDGLLSRTLSLDILSGVPNSEDTVWATIVADSLLSNQALHSNGNLNLSYVGWKDASYKHRSRIDVLAFQKALPVPVAAAPTVPTKSVSETPETLSVRTEIVKPVLVEEKPEVAKIRKRIPSRKRVKPAEESVVVQTVPDTIPAAVVQQPIEESVDMPSNEEGDGYSLSLADALIGIWLLLVIIVGAMYLRQRIKNGGRW